MNLKLEKHVVRNNLIVTTGLAFSFAVCPISSVYASGFVKTMERNAIVQQDKVVKGKVLDENGEPMIGVSVKLEGKSKGAITDFDGNFTINGVAASDIISITYMGYKSQSFSVDKLPSVIKMQPDMELLDEVVVIGYGTVKKRDLTGAVSSVKSEEIVKAPTGNVMEAISGKVAGLDITRDSGSAGSKVNMTLRGNRSINGSNTPLFIIDGVEGNYEELNPNDIESVEVLKDASSTAIYGSAGANGVVIITTKKGQEGKTSISLDAYYGVNGFTSFPGVLMNDSYIQLRREANRTAGLWNSPADDASIFSAKEWEFIQNNNWVDWYDEATRDGILQSYTLSMNGGTENTKSYFSINYYDEEGILEKDEYTRYTLNANIDKKVNNWLKGGLKIQGTYIDKDTRDNQIWTRMLCISPLGIPYDENGNVVEYPGDVQEVSPLADTAPNAYVDNTRTLSFAPTGYLEFTPIKGLSFKSVLGAYLAFSRQGIYYSAQSANGHEASQSTAGINNTNTFNYKWENILNYNFNIGSEHSFTFTGVTSWSKKKYETSGATGYNVDWDKYAFYNLGVTDSDGREISSSYVGSQMMSYVLRLNYSFLGKYLLTLSNRWDGSSMLAKGNQWDTFPAAAIAWRISDEAFMKDIDWISNLKLRVGYGVTGNAGAKEYATLSMGFAGSNLAFQDIAAPFYIPAQTIANKQLGWEKSYSTNIGIDFSVFNNRINLTLDFYNTDTEDILFQRTLPSSLGGLKTSNYNIWQNICATNNKGIELAINTHNIDNKNFKWTTDFTFALNKEKITEFTSDSPVKNGDYYLIEGQPINTYYDYRYEGIWQEYEADEAAKYPDTKPGYIKVTDVDENHEYTSADYCILGSSNPDWTAGMVNSFQIYDFDFSFQLQARYGQTIKADILGWYCPSGVYNSPSICDYWTPENPSGRFPRPDINHQRLNNYPASSSLLYVDGSYLKVKNITLGYTLPDNILNKVGFSRARLYATFSNPFIFTKSKYLKDYDPERGGADTLPLSKQMVFGINVTF